MLVNGIPMRTIWAHPHQALTVCLLDQRLLPHKVEILEISDWQSMAKAIAEMAVRGAPLIGVSAAYGMALGAKNCGGLSPAQAMAAMEKVQAALFATRPTAVNLRWALHKQMEQVKSWDQSAPLAEILWKNAEHLAEKDVECCRKIGDYGLDLLSKLYQQKGKPLQILTHCNAGWLACLDWGTATAPIYRAHQKKIPLAVWVDETRPRNQGAKLTAWELGQQGIEHTLITDNAGGHLMQRAMVDCVLVGADRITRNGDVANKIGTYLKALAARAHNIPFLVAAPLSTVDWDLVSGNEIPIEDRGAKEVCWIDGVDAQGVWHEVRTCPPDTGACNPGFDVTPAALISSIITENGVVPATEKALQSIRRQA